MCVYVCFTSHMISFLYQPVHTCHIKDFLILKTFLSQLTSTNLYLPLCNLILIDHKSFYTLFFSQEIYSVMYENFKITVDLLRFNNNNNKTYLFDLAF